MSTNAVSSPEAEGQVFYQTTLSGASHWSCRVRRGTALKLTDVQGGANLAMLFYNPENLLERYNAPDTLKCQHTFKLTRGHCLYSDMGRIFCSITDDSLGAHETMCGNANAQTVATRWGQHNYQDYHNDWHQNGYQSFLVELEKYGLNGRDMAANMNWFSAVQVDEPGDIRFVENHSRVGDSLELRFEMDTLVLMHTCPHPLNPASEYPRRPVHLQFHRAAPVSAEDYCRNLCAENQRGFQNNAIYHMGLPGAETQQAGGL